MNAQQALDLLPQAAGDSAILWASPCSIVEKGIVENLTMAHGNKYGGLTVAQLATLCSSSDNLITHHLAQLMDRGVVRMEYHEHTPPTYALVGART